MIIHQPHLSNSPRIGQSLRPCQVTNAEARRVTPTIKQNICRLARYVRVYPRVHRMNLPRTTFLMTYLLYFRETSYSATTPHLPIRRSLTMVSPVMMISKQLPIGSSGFLYESCPDWPVTSDSALPNTFNQSPSALNVAVLPKCPIYYRSLQHIHTLGQLYDTLWRTERGVQERIRVGSCKKMAFSRFPHHRAWDFCFRPDRSYSSGAKASKTGNPIMNLANLVLAKTSAITALPTMGFFIYLFYVFILPTQDIDLQ